MRTRQFTEQKLQEMVKGIVESKLNEEKSKKALIDKIHDALLKVREFKNLSLDLRTKISANIKKMIAE